MPKLFIPGPVEVEKEILTHMAKPMIGHRTQEFKTLFKNITTNLKQLLNTNSNIFLMTCSATGAMEAAMRNCVKKKVLILSNGEFAKRWNEIAISNNKKTKLLDFGNGNSYNFKQIEKELKTNSYDCLAMIFNETSTGIENNIEKIKTILKNHPQITLLVDGVSGVFGSQINTKNIDILIFGTQKALALPPGITISVVSNKTIKKAKTIKNRGFYFDYIKLLESANENLTPTTPNISLLYTLEERLENIKKLELENWLEKHKTNQKLVRDFFKKKDFELFIDDENSSKTLTVIINNKNMNLNNLISHLKYNDFMIGKGYADMKDKAIRISHMIETKETIKLLNEIENYLNKFENLNQN